MRSPARDRGAVGDVDRDDGAGHGRAQLRVGRPGLAIASRRGAAPSPRDACSGRRRAWSRRRACTHSSPSAALAHRHARGRARVPSDQRAGRAAGRDFGAAVPQASPRRSRPPRSRSAAPRGAAARSDAASPFRRPERAARRATRSRDTASGSRARRRGADGLCAIRRSAAISPGRRRRHRSASFGRRRGDERRHPVDEPGVHRPGDDLGLGEQRAQERDVRVDAEHDGVGERGVEPGERLGAIGAVRDDLRDHRVVVGRDDRSGLDRGIRAHALGRLATPAHRPSPGGSPRSGLSA